nr:hypothetical protein [uncultured Corynebacterium sp.]
MTDSIRVIMVDEQQLLRRGLCGHARHGWPRLGCGVSTALTGLTGHYLHDV